MFRAERPQAGRLRQFNQIGIEAIGSTSPALDAEVVKVMAAVLDSAGIKDYAIKINNLGCREDKKALSAALRKAFSGKEAKLLCDDCKKRLKANPLRVLDCKNDGCRIIVRKTFKETGFLCKECKAYFDRVRSFLDLAGIKYTIDPFMVRGLDYYTRTVFEVTSASLGSQDAIGAGGRYDDLTSDMGGPDVGACGFALGMERMMLVLEKRPAIKSGKPAIEVFIASIGEAAYEKAFVLAGTLRKSGISCDIDYEGRSLKAQMRRADSLGAGSVLIIGEDELRSGEAVLRDMKTKEQKPVRFDEIAQVLKR
jgi:histidyl-tRNA synthetase